MILHYLLLRNDHIPNGLTRVNICFCYSLLHLPQQLYIQTLIRSHIFQDQRLHLIQGCQKGQILC